MDDHEYTTVFRAPQRRACDERLLVLLAVGIDGQVIMGDGEFELQVAWAQTADARLHLLQYEAENRRPAPPPPLRLYPYAWVGCFGYALVLLGVAWLLSNGVLRLDAFELGELNAAAVQAGQWWRAWTALTLHVDGPHLAANLAAGLWFGYLAARQMGVGLAWLLTVSAAAAANLLEGLLAAPDRISVGASTAVFAALGAMAAHAWRQQLAPRERWARRWGPLIAGVILLGWFGSSGEQTDLVAHLGGFVVGALLGASAALPRVQRLLLRVPQSLMGAAALASLLLAWVCALRS